MLGLIDGFVLARDWWVCVGSDRWVCVGMVEGLSWVCSILWVFC